MPSPSHHPNCPRCHGEGFYLAKAGQGYMRDGSFSHNRWEDCYCYPDMPIDQLPRSLDPPPTYAIVHHPQNPNQWYWLIIKHDRKGSFGRPEKIITLGLDGIDGYQP